MGRYKGRFRGHSLMSMSIIKVLVLQCNTFSCVNNEVRGRRGYVGELGLYG